MSQSFICSAVRRWRRCSVCWLLQQPRRLREDVATATAVQACWLIEEKEAFDADVGWSGPVLKISDWLERCQAGSVSQTDVAELTFWHQPVAPTSWGWLAVVSSLSCLMSRGTVDKEGGGGADSCLRCCSGWQGTSSTRKCSHLPNPSLLFLSHCAASSQSMRSSLCWSCDICS